MKDKKIKPGQGLWLIQLYNQQLIRLFEEARSSADPALFLYKHKARDILFMAESVTRLLSRSFEDKKTEAILKTYKKLEDCLGEIDDNDHLFKIFSGIKTVKKNQSRFFAMKRDKLLQKLNRKLMEKDFYIQRFHTIAKQLEINFNDKELITELQKEMQAEIVRAFVFYNKHRGKLKEMEGQVHEIRRKLRWLSIYAQSLQGIISLKPQKRHFVWEKEFITKPELKSDFNKLKVRKKLVSHIFIGKKAFYALNYVIRVLGEIKDQGLSMEALAKIARSSKKQSLESARELLRLPTAEPDLLKQADALLHKFFLTYQIHENLL